MKKIFFAFLQNDVLISMNKQSINTYFLNK